MTRALYGHGNEKRDAAGVIVTMRHRATGELQSVHRPGGAKVALRAVLALFDPGEWCCQTVSTPRTIAIDVKGTRKLHEQRRAPVTGFAYRVQVAQSPETALLSAVQAMEYAA